MAEVGEFPQIEIDDLVVAVLNTFDIHDAENYKDKAAEYRKIMADIVDLINLCNIQIEKYKKSSDDYNLYTVSGRKMHEEYVLKRDALVRLLPILKNRFVDDYKKESFLAQINEITEEAFPPSDYRRTSASRANYELRKEINKIYDMRDGPVKVAHIKEFEEDADLDYVNKKRLYDPCFRLIKSLQFFADGGKLEFGEEYKDHNGRLQYTRYFDLLKPYETPQLYRKFKNALAAMVEGKFKTESELYQRQETSNGFAKIPSASDDWDKKIDQIMSNINAIIDEEYLWGSFPYNKLVIMAKAYVREYKKEMKKRDNNIASEDTPYFIGTGQDWKSWQIAYEKYKKQHPELYPEGGEKK